jgi:hypothetical protein
MYERLEEAAAARGFESVDMFVIFLLRQALGRREVAPSTEASYSKEDVERIRNQLRSLGYL